MKNCSLKIVIIFFFFFAALNTNAQIEIKVNGLSAILEELSFSTEYIINKNIGAELDLLYSEDNRGIWLSTKYYYGPNLGADRFYATLFLATYNEELGLGFGVGYKFLSREGLSFELAFGGGQDFKKLGHDFDKPIPYYKISFGYRFGKKSK